MMKRNGKYILMYSGASCHDETYNVRYSYKASGNTLPQDLVIDLGSVRKVKRVLSHFEFASYNYQYRIEGNKTEDYKRPGTGWCGRYRRISVINAQS